jgi:hypothetical protein
MQKNIVAEEKYYLGDGSPYDIYYFGRSVWAHFATTLRIIQDKSKPITMIYFLVKYKQITATLSPVARKEAGGQ